MRNVISTNAHIDVTEEYSDAVDGLLGDSSPGKVAVLRQTYLREHDQPTFRVRVVAYDAPDTGESRWAVDYFDAASREVGEVDNLEEAEARYEELVRETVASAGSGQDGDPEPFTYSDVDGVPVKA